MPYFSVSVCVFLVLSVCGRASLPDTDIDPMMSSTTVCAPTPFHAQAQRANRCEFASVYVVGNCDWYGGYL